MAILIEWMIFECDYLGCRESARFSTTDGAEDASWQINTNATDSKENWTVFCPDHAEEHRI